MCALLISIHAPRTGSDRCRAVRKVGYLISIHAPRTGSDELGRHQQSIQRVYFNPRSPHGERPATDGRCTTIAKHFNPRSPHGERRRRNMAVRAYPEFQSTLPARGATVIGNAERKIQSAFQSTLPARGATVIVSVPYAPAVISIHAPRTGSDTTDGDAQAPPRKISIHAPRTGSDMAIVFSVPSHTNFNPRSPHGERRICFSRRFVL